MTRRALAAVEFLVWWAALTALWTVLISAVDALEWAVGTSAALLAAVAAVAVRRAVTDR